MWCSSFDTVVSVISRLSVLIVIRAPRLKYSRSGCSAMLVTAPVCTLDDGQHSSGMRWSIT
jgi:hypothetical protein